MGSHNAVLAMILFCSSIAVNGLVSRSAVGVRLPYTLMTGIQPSTLQNSEDSLRLRGGEQSSDSPRSTDSNKWVPSASAELHDNINLVVLTALGLSSIWALIVGEKFFGNLLTWIGFAVVDKAQLFEKLLIQ